MKSAPHLSLVWNRDWAEPTNPLYDPSTFVGAVYENALLAGAGLIPKGPLPPEALELFKAQVRAQQNG